MTSQVNGKHLCETPALFQDDTINLKTRKYMWSSDDKIVGKIFPEWANCQAYSKEKRKLGKYSPESKSPHGGGWWMEPVTVWRGWSCKGKFKQATGIHCNSCIIYLGISRGPKSRQWATWSTLESKMYDKLNQQNYRSWGEISYWKLNIDTLLENINAARSKSRGRKIGLTSVFYL